MPELLPKNIAIVRDTYDIIAENFSPMLDRDCASDYEILAVNDFIAKLKPESNIVDLGCGLGKHGRYCASKGMFATGYDISPKMIELAQKYNNTPNFPVMTALLVDNICDFQTSEKYDGAICCYTLIHLTREQAAQTLLNLKHCLNDGAYLFITVYKGMREDYTEEELAPGSQMFFKDYSEEELVSLLTSSGYGYPEVIVWNDEDAITAGDPEMDAPVLGVQACYKRETDVRT